MVSKSKYFYAAFATAAIVSGVTAAVPTMIEASTKFPDVKENQYYYEAIQSLADRGIIHGYPNGNFGPNDHVTREQVAKMIAGVLDLDTNNVTNPNFKDVDTSHPYYRYIAALQNAGIIDGNDLGEFSPSEPIQRNHMAKIISNAYNIVATENTELPFIDVMEHYEDYIAGLYEFGITTGVTATKFNGKAMVSRGELAVFIQRAENIETETDVDVIINHISNNAIQTSGGTFTADSSLNKFFHSTNGESLKDAQLEATVKNGEIINITSLTLNNAGTAELPVVLDGAGTTIAGNLQVNADFVIVKNLYIQNEMTLTDEVINSFTGDTIVADGALVIEEGQASPVASLTDTNVGKLTLELNQSEVTKVITKRNNVKILSDITIPFFEVSGSVSTIDINSDVEELLVNVNGDFEVNGAGKITELVLESDGEMTLDFKGEIGKLIVKNKNTKVELGANLLINELQIPTGSNPSTILKNYDSIKNKIKRIICDNGQVVNNPGGNNGSGGNSDGGNSGGSPGGDNGSDPGGDNGGGEPQNPGTDLPAGVYDGKDFSGTLSKPKVYAGNVTVNVADINKLENAFIKGNLTIKGSVTGSFTFTNITVEGNFDYSDLEADSYTLTGITVSGDTIQ